MTQTKNVTALDFSSGQSRSVAVIGAGPIGLAAAAHLVERGIDPIIFESGADVASNMASFGHVKLFSPWKYNIDGAALKLLTAAGWQAPEEDDLPSAQQIIDRYLRPLSQLEQIAKTIHFNHKIVAIARLQADKAKTRERETQPFVIRAQTPHGVEEYRVSAVIDASGTWQNPNPMGSNGLPALGEEAFQSRISYGMPDISGAQESIYANESVLVVGSGHSALGNLLNLVELAEKHPATQVTWAVRSDGSQDQLRRIFGGGDNDQLAARGKLGKSLEKLLQQQRVRMITNFQTQQLVQQKNGQLTLISLDDQRRENIDRVIVSTGARPNWEINRELRLSLDTLLECTHQLSSLIDPNEHSCGTVPPHGYRELSHPEPGFYAIGAKSYGRAPNFLMATGYEQARSVVAALAQDWEAADDVQLNLPQTGVCEADFSLGSSTCCGGESATSREQPNNGISVANKVDASNCGCSPASSDAAANRAKDELSKSNTCCA